MRNYVSPANGRGPTIAGDAGTAAARQKTIEASHCETSLGDKRIKARSGLEIPLDVLFLIFSECDAKSLIICRLVCRHFDGFITSQKPLLYKLALYFERQVDCCRPHINCQISGSSGSLASSTSTPASLSTTPTFSLSSHQKLQRLRRQCLAWRGAVPPGLKTTIPVTRSDSIYELNGGIFALGDVATVDGWVIGPSGELTSTRGIGLDFVRLPSIIAGMTGPEWTHINIGEKISIVDFTMDVELDLLVLIEQKVSTTGDQRHPAPYRLHLLSLSLSTNTLTQHPMANFPVVEYPCHPDWWEYQLVLNIYGDHLGLLFSSGRSASCGYDRVVVWDWKTGQLSAMHAEDDVYESFVFLRAGHILLPSVTTASLDIYHYTFNESDFGSHTGYGPAIPGPMTCIMKFELPMVQAGLGYGFILARSQPTGRPSDFKETNTQTVPPSSLRNDYITRDTSSPSSKYDKPSHSGGANSDRAPVHITSDNNHGQDGQSGQEDHDSLNANANTNVFAHYHPPFAPSIDDSIIVISIHIGRTADDTGEAGTGDERELKDADGTLIVKRSLFRCWLEKEEDLRKILEVMWEGSGLSNFTAPEMVTVVPKKEEYMDQVSLDGIMPTPSHVSQSVQTVPEAELSTSVSMPTPSWMPPWLPGPTSLPRPLNLSPQKRLYFANELSNLSEYNQNRRPHDPIPPLAAPTIVRWPEWMHRSRWLRGMGSPRWVRDVHGTRVATRVVERPREVTPALIPGPPHGQAFNVNTFTSAQTNQGQDYLQDNPQAMAQHLSQHSSGSTITFPFSHPNPMPIIHPNDQHAALLQAPIQVQVQANVQPQAQVAGNGMVFLQPPANETYAKTRLYDFNNLPSVRAPETIPYPRNLRLDLTPESTSDSSSSSNANSTSSAGASKAVWNIDRGWSIIRPEDGLEWIRRPVWDDTLIEPGVTFAEEICTSLPYLEITSSTSTDCTGLMIDAERIIGMKTDENGNLVSLEVVTM